MGPWLPARRRSRSLHRSPFVLRALGVRRRLRRPSSSHLANLTCKRVRAQMQRPRSAGGSDEGLQLGPRGVEVTPTHRRPWPQGTTSPFVCRDQLTKVLAVQSNFPILTGSAPRDPNANASKRKRQRHPRGNRRVREGAGRGRGGVHYDSREGDRGGEARRHGHEAQPDGRICKWSSPTRQSKGCRWASRTQLRGEPPLPCHLHRRTRPGIARPRSPRPGGHRAEGAPHHTPTARQGERGDQGRRARDPPCGCGQSEDAKTPCVQPLLSAHHRNDTRPKGRGRSLREHSRPKSRRRGCSGRGPHHLYQGP